MHERLRPPLRAVGTAVASYTHEKFQLYEAASKSGASPSVQTTRLIGGPAVPNYSQYLEFKVLRQRAITYHLMGHHRKAAKELFEAIGQGIYLSVEPSILAELYFHLGDAYFWLQSHEDTRLISATGVSRLEPTGCPEIMLLFENLRRAHRGMGQMAEAITYAERNQEQLQNNSPFPYIGRVYHGVAWTLGVEMKRYQQAFDILQEGLQVCEQQGDDWSVCQCYHSMADVLDFQKQFGQAIPLYRRAIEIAELLGYEDMVLYSYMDLGRMLLQQDELGLAEAAFRTGLARASSGETYIVHAWLGLVNIYRRVDNPTARKEALAQLSQHCMSYSPNHALQSLHELGMVYMEEGEYEIASQHFMDGIRQVKKHSYGLAQFLDGLQACYAALGKQAVFGLVSHQLRQQKSEETALAQWRLSPASPSDEFPHTSFHDMFHTSRLQRVWCWVDPCGDSSYYPLGSTEQGTVLEAGANRIVPTKGMLISVPPNHWLWVKRNFSAPRLVLETQGDFAVETCVLTDQLPDSLLSTQPSIAAQPSVNTRYTRGNAGLMVWICEHDHLHLELDANDNIHFWRSDDGQAEIIGRGRFVAPSVYLRLERSEHHFRALCSRNGKDWFTCGECQLELPAWTDVGIYAASCGEDMTMAQFAHFNLSIRGATHVKQT